MATFTIPNVSIKGVACCVPPAIVENLKHSFFSQEDMEKFVDATGVKQRRRVEKNVCTSDLCVKAGEELLKSINWSPSDIEVIVLITQSADYLLPISSALIQNRLGISTKCICIDIPLGCSGYVYGMSVLGALMNSGKFKKGLLFAGDTSSKSVSKKDKSTEPLFGDAASATAFEYNENAAEMKFDLGSDGSGYEAIIIKDGGFRNQTTVDSFTEKEYQEGIIRNDCQLVLDGMEVFSFGISQAPKTVNALVDFYQIDKSIVDFYIFHQANLMMNKKIAKKLKLEDEKVPISLDEFGNTSSASIPMTIVTRLQNQINNKSSKLILCGFGVGLSWGTVYLETTNDFSIVNLVEY
ncbi:MAG: hypothetical protein RL065_713 [Bacteroidota bacterium]|jgi:3-oxoacyl-[acyl-carrier-protein] synthase-3